VKSGTCSVGGDRRSIKWDDTAEVKVFMRAQKDLFGLASGKREGGFVQVFGGGGAEAGQEGTKGGVSGSFLYEECMLVGLMNIWWTKGVEGLPPR